MLFSFTVDSPKTCLVSRDEGFKVGERGDAEESGTQERGCKTGSAARDAMK